MSVILRALKAIWTWLMAKPARWIWLIGSAIVLFLSLQLLAARRREIATKLHAIDDVLAAKTTPKEETARLAQERNELARQLADLDRGHNVVAQQAQDAAQRRKEIWSRYAD